MSKELIRLQDLTMEFDGERILDGINLYFNDHEFLTLLGPSGCGKSTTLRIIGGFLTPTSGTVTFDGQVINDVPPYKRQINTVFQRYALFPHLDVYENIAFGLRVAKLPKAEIYEKVHAMLGEIDKIENADPMLCGTKGTYVTAGSPAFMEKMANHYSPLTWVDNLYEIDDDIFKVSVYDATGDIKNHTYLPLAEKFRGENTIHMSANIWVDIMDKTADKGLAIQSLQKMFGVTMEETMAFGDFYNDEPLLKNAKYAFIMENAPDDLKEKYPYRTSSNNDSGVTKAIWESVIHKYDLK